MTVVLPIEEMARLQVSFKLIVPDGRLSCCMTSDLSSGPLSFPTPSLSGLKIHFEAVPDPSGLSLKVWTSASQGNAIPGSLHRDDNALLHCQETYIPAGELIFPSIIGSQSESHPGSSSDAQRYATSSGCFKSPASASGPSSMDMNTVGGFDGSPLRRPSSGPSSAGSQVCVSAKDAGSSHHDTDLAQWQTMNASELETSDAFEYLKSFGFGEGQWPMNSKHDRCHQ